MADRTVGKAVLGSLLPLLLLGLWWLGTRSGTAVVPTFASLIDVLLHPFRTPPALSSRSLAFSLLMTLLRLAIGFGLGVLTAIPLGFWAGTNRAVDRILYPFVQLSRSVNPVVLLPIVTVLFGLSSVASVVVGRWRRGSTICGTRCSWR